MVQSAAPKRGETVDAPPPETVFRQCLSSFQEDEGEKPEFVSPKT